MWARLINPTLGWIGFLIITQLLMVAATSAFGSGIALANKGVFWHGGLIAGGIGLFVCAIINFVIFFNLSPWAHKF